MVPGAADSVPICTGAGVCVLRTAGEPFFFFGFAITLALALVAPPAAVVDARPDHASTRGRTVPFVGVRPTPSQSAPASLSDEALERQAARIAVRARIVGLVCAVGALALSLICLIGWALHVDALVRWRQEWPRMMPATGVLAALVALSLALPSTVAAAMRRRVLLGVAAVVGLVALLHLVGQEVALAPRVARLLFPEALRAAGDPGWMSPASALGTLALACCLAALSRRRVRWAQGCALLAVAIGLVGMATYIVGPSYTPFLPPYRTMALPAALAIALLGISGLAVHATEGVLPLLTGADAGAYLARQLLPYAVLVPFWLRAVELVAESFGVPPHVARVVTLLGFVVGGVAITLRMAHLFRRADRHRRRIEGELRDAERELRQQEERTRIALQLTGIGTFEYDIASGRQILSGHARTLWGFGPDDEVSPQAVRRAIHPDDRKLASLPPAALAVGGTGAFAFEHRVVLPDGSTRWMETRGHTLFQHDGGQPRPVRVVGTMRDVTEQRLLDARAHEAEERARLALDAAALGAYDLDPRSRQVTWDARVCELLGLEPCDGQGWAHLQAALHPGDAARLEAALAGASKPGAEAALALDCRVVEGGTGAARIVHLTGRAFIEDGEAVRIVGTMQDVTETREAEAKFRGFADSVPALCWIMDAAGQVTYVNQPWRAYMGLDAPELLDRWVDLLHPDDRPESLRRWTHSLATGDEFEVENRLLGVDGEYRWFLSRARAQRDAGGRVVRWFGASVDVHGARQYAQALARSEQAFRIFIDSIPSPAWTMRADGVTDYVNRPWREYLGVSEDGASWQEWSRFLHPDDVERTLSRWQRTLDTGEEYETEYRLRGADGSYRWFLARVRAQRDEAGRVVRWFGTATDIDAVKELEVALRESEATFRIFADAIPSLGWTASADGRVTFVNAQWTAYTGLTTEASLADPSVPLHPDDRAAAIESWGAAVAQGHPHELAYRLRRHDGVYRWFLARTWPQRDARGTVLRWFGTGTDIDDAKRAEKVMRDTESALREADRRKDEFLATLAHELRNPLAPIRQASRLASMAEATPAQVQWSHGVIDRQVTGMARLLDDLLDVSRITRGRLELRQEWVTVAALIESAVETARPLIDARQHRLAIDLPSRPTRVQVDPLRMSQVVANLLTNAAKYTPPGGDLHLTARPDDGHFVVQVRDTGVGIAADMLPRVFEMFAQATPALERTEGGLGIGLALVRGIVELHGGSVHAASDGPGRGSTFTVRVPNSLAPDGLPAPDADAHRARSPRARRRVLVADDNVDGAESLAALLRVWGHEVLVAHDGEAALALADATEPDVLLLDIGMPGLNGYELAAAVRERSWGERAVLVAVTGWGHEEDRRRSLAAGFEVHFTKPVDPSALRTVLGRRVAS
jgi:PAS domain S-box-containing protein